MKNKLLWSVWLILFIINVISGYRDDPDRNVILTTLLAFMIATTAMSAGAAGRKEKWGLCIFTLALPTTVALYAFNVGAWLAFAIGLMALFFFAIEHDRVTQMRKTEQEFERVLREDRKDLDEQYDKLMRLAK